MIRACPVDRLMLGLSALALLIGAPSVQSTVLVFEPAAGTFGDFAVLPPGYGNRVTGAVQDGFLYGLDGGPTPHIVTAYNVGGLPVLFSWANDFGDLKHVIFAQEPHVFELQLVADPGYRVVLNSLDMAAWPYLDYTINSVEILNQNDTPLYSENSVLILGAINGSDPQHTHFDFSGISGTVLKIRYDSTNMDSDDIGIDNIDFSEAASVPGDVDGDGHVDVVDLLYLVDAFGSVTGDANYDPRCDFNSDGSVDVVDLLILVENFGT
jgi:hypothetical protein